MSDVDPFAPAIPIADFVKKVCSDLSVSPEAVLVAFLRQTVNYAVTSGGSEPAKGEIGVVRDFLLNLESAASKVNIDRGLAAGSLDTRKGDVIELKVLNTLVANALKLAHQNVRAI